MLSKFINKVKVSEEEFLKELLNTPFNSEKITTIYEQLKIDLNSYYYKDEQILHYCCKKYLYQAVLWLLEQGVDVEIENEQKETPIFSAVYTKNSAILQLLLEYKANFDHLNIYNRTALQDSVVGANNKVIGFLFDNTKNLSNCDIHGNNLIFDAVASGDTDLIKKVASTKKVNLNQINEDGDTVLHKEKVLANKDLALLLINLGVNPTILDKNGNNILFHTIKKGYEDFALIEKSVQLGHDINFKNKANKTLLMEAVDLYLNISAEEKKQKENFLLLIEALIKFGVRAETTTNNNENVLFWAIRAEDKDLITLLLTKSDININHENDNGETVLSIAVLNGARNNDLIKSFLKYGADPTLTNRFGKSIVEILIDVILHIQNRKPLDFDYEILLNEDGEYPSVLENLLKYCQIDINKLNSKGEPLFFQSILHFNFNLFKILRTRKLDLNLKDKDGNNIVFKLMAYNYAKKIKDKKLYLNTLKSLINVGIDINARNNEGLTALHIAVGEKCEYTIRLLLELRADCFATDPKGRSIMHNCIWKNTTKYFKLIHNYNKEIINIPDAFGVRPINYAAFMGKKDLVIEMLDEGALINNPNKKDPKILKFLEKFHQNIINITNGVEKEVDKLNLQHLADNMIAEFDIKV